MRSIPLLLVVFIFPRIISAQSVDVEHYRFQIELSDQHDTIHAIATLRVKFLSSSDRFDLNLVQSTGGKKGMMVGKVRAAGLQTHSSLPAEKKVRFKFNNTHSIGDTVTVTVHYSGVPADGLIISKTKYGHRSFFADNWPDRGQNWLLCNDHPADKAPVEFIVVAPDHYQVVANGLQVEESTLSNNRKLTHWKEDVPISTKVMVIGVADFAVQKNGVINDCIPVYSWVYPEDRSKGFSEYAVASQVLQYFIDYVGPYPYKKLANVQSKTTFGGLENANTIFYHENSATGDGKNESLVAHEVAHQWFGNHATEKTFAHLWLSEGFATYMAILYFEHFYGRDTAVFFLKEDRANVAGFAKTSKRPVVDSMETNYMALLNENSYEKGSWVLHMLRSEFGDSLFKKAIRTYYERYAGKVAGTEDLKKVFEEVTGKDLRAFFDQWLYGPGIPQLKSSWTYDGKNKKLLITVEQLQTNLFDFPLEFGIPESKNAIKTHISKRKETFTFSLDKIPSRVDLDPGTKLLFSE